jgi:hypothetical protein
VVIVEVVGYIVDRVSVGLFEETGGRVGHSDNAISYVGQV